MTVIDSAVYIDGKRALVPKSFRQTFRRTPLLHGCVRPLFLLGRAAPPQQVGDRCGRRVSLREQLKERADHSDIELRRALRDVSDHAARVLERIEGLRQLLGNILTVNAALVAQRQNDEITSLAEAGYEQNEQVKRISSWAAILFAPTLITSICGMNFDHMPELGWQLGYPFAILLMLLLGLGLYAIFKRRGWL